MRRIFAGVLAGIVLAAAWGGPARARAAEAGDVFCIGRADGSSMEFGLTKEMWHGYEKAYPDPVVFRVGRDPLARWPYIHPSRNDKWAGAKDHTFTIEFALEQKPAKDLHLVIGVTETWEPAEMVVSVNGTEAGRQRVPNGSGNSSGDPRRPGKAQAMVFAIPAGRFQAGGNRIALTMAGGSWILYDYVRLSTDPKPAKIADPAEKAWTDALAGPLADVREVVFSARRPGNDGHWYANFGYYCFDPNRKMYNDGAHLYRLDLRTRKLASILDDARGGIRDPQVDYDGKKVLFSYRKGGSEHYHLYEINLDGTGLRQLTDGDCDDLEPTYMPDGSIVFVSSRCNRWVNCWMTPVAILYRCNADGSNIHPISSNNEQDNTPWPLADGRILYTRWEYVDRSQVDYHHLWVVNPDGTGQMVYYGNERPGVLMIDARPIPGSDKIVSIFSPGHGMREHQGAVTVISPKRGPDEAGAARRISRGDDFKDPWAFGEDAFLAASGPALVFLDGAGAQREVFRLPEADARAGMELQEPRPVVARKREPIVPDRVKAEQATGRLVLTDVNYGRNMAGVKPGEIKKLLVLETLPKPVNFTGGMDPLSYGGTFTLERVLGTVPVEADGSAYIELPALRSVFFVALDENDLAVKRMQSFVTVQPGETTSCAGCHEQRVKTPHAMTSGAVMALRRAPSAITPIADVPDVFDYPRDIQPILDRHCVDCHGVEKTARGGPYAGNVLLTGDRGPMFSHSYYTMSVRRIFSDGRNQPRSNYAPRSLGSSASPIFKLVDGSHHGVKIDDRERKILRLWIDSGCAYPGTYASLGSGMIGGYQMNEPVNTDYQWPATVAGAEVINRRCASCHREGKVLPRAMSDERDVSFWRFDLNDPRLRMSRHIAFNLTRPEKSLMLLAPLATEGGGLALCRDSAGKPANIFANASDPDYAKLLAMAAAGKENLDKIKRFDMPDFYPRADWVREMKNYGILPASFQPGDKVDVYATERRYWESFWYRPG